MFKQLEYLEILFKSSVQKFDRCVFDEGSIGNEVFFSVPVEINLIFRLPIMRNNLLSLLS